MKTVYVGINCRNILDLKKVTFNVTTERDMIAEGLKHLHGSEEDVVREYWLNEDQSMNFNHIINDVINNKCAVSNMYGLGEEYELIEESDYIKTFLTKKVYTVCNGIPSYMSEGVEMVGTIDEIVKQLERDEDGKVYHNDMLPVTIVDRNEDEFYIIAPTGFSKEEAYNQADAFLAVS